MINLRKALVASALALSIAVPAGTPVFANSGTTITCPQQSQTFPFVLPPGLIPNVTSGNLVLSPETGQGGVCSGTFDVNVGALIASGTFTAIHRGSTVTVFFHTTSSPSGINARGFVFYDSASKKGIVATKLTSAGLCEIVVAQFAGSPSTGFAIVGNPLFFPCF